MCRGCNAPSEWLRHKLNQVGRTSKPLGSRLAPMEEEGLKCCINNGQVLGRWIGHKPSLRWIVEQICKPGIIRILNKYWTKTEQILNKYLTNTEQYWTNLQTIYHQNTHRGPLVDNAATTRSNLTKLFQFPKEEQTLTIWFNFDMILKQFCCFGFQKKSQLT